MSGFFCVPAPALFVVSALVLLPFGRLVELPLGLLALLGAALVPRFLQRGGTPQFRLPLLLYGLFLLPMLLALPDAVNGGKSLLTTAGSLRYLFSTLALLWLWEQSRDPQQLRERTLYLLGLVTSWLLLLWGLDALLQFLWGRDILGYGVRQGYLNGPFGDGDSLKFGITMALLLPLGLLHGLRHWPRPVAIVYALFLLAVVGLSGKRAAWIVVMVQLAALGLYGLRCGVINRRVLFAAALLVVAASILAYASSDHVRQRSNVVVNALLHPDYASLNKATALRLPIWEAAVKMAADNWVNGVGPRGFRYAYRDYADPDHRWAQILPEGGAAASHAHQLLLELACETGLPGLLAYLAMVAVLIRAWQTADAAARSRALPFALVLLGMLFPVNTHPAWYSSWSALLLWLFIGLYLLAIGSLESRGGRSP